MTVQEAKNFIRDYINRRNQDVEGRLDFFIQKGYERLTNFDFSFFYSELISEINKSLVDEFVENAEIPLWLIEWGIYNRLGTWYEIKKIEEFYIKDEKCLTNIEKLVAGKQYVRLRVKSQDLDGDGIGLILNQRDDYPIDFHNRNVIDKHFTTLFSGEPFGYFLPTKEQVWTEYYQLVEPAMTKEESDVLYVKRVSVWDEEDGRTLLDEELDPPEPLPPYRFLWRYVAKWVNWDTSRYYRFSLRFDKKFDVVNNWFVFRWGERSYLPDSFINAQPVWYPLFTISFYKNDVLLFRLIRMKGVDNWGILNFNENRHDRFGFWYINYQQSWSESPVGGQNLTVWFRINKNTDKVEMILRRTFDNANLRWWQGEVESIYNEEDLKNLEMEINFIQKGETTYFLEWFGMKQVERGVRSHLQYYSRWEDWRDWGNIDYDDIKIFTFPSVSELEGGRKWRKLEFKNVEFLSERKVKVEETRYFFIEDGEINIFHLFEGKVKGKGKKIKIFPQFEVQDGLKVKIKGKFVPKRWEDCEELWTRYLELLAKATYVEVLKYLNEFELARVVEQDLLNSAVAITLEEARIYTHGGYQEIRLKDFSTAREVK